MSDGIRAGGREIHAGTDLGSDPVTWFGGQHAFLANPYPCLVMHDGLVFPSAEHAFHAAKSADYQIRREIARLGTWQEAKRTGRQLALRPGWDQLRRPVMLQLVLDKFLRNPDLAGLLIATGQRMLLEGNWWGDTDWGAVSENHRSWSGSLPWWHHGGRVWAGYNWLGWTLMVVRDVLTLEC